MSETDSRRVVVAFEMESVVEAEAYLAENRTVRAYTDCVRVPEAIRSALAEPVEAEWFCPNGSLHGDQFDDNEPYFHCKHGFRKAKHERGYWIELPRRDSARGKS